MEMNLDAINLYGIEVKRFPLREETKELVRREMKEHIKARTINEEIIEETIEISESIDFWRLIMFIRDYLGKNQIVTKKVRKLFSGCKEYGGYVDEITQRNGYPATRTFIGYPLEMFVNGEIDKETANMEIYWLLEFLCGKEIAEENKPRIINRVWLNDDTNWKSIELENSANCNTKIWEE